MSRKQAQTLQMPISTALETLGSKHIWARQTPGGVQELLSGWTQGGHRHKSGHPRNSQTTHVVLVLDHCHQTEALSPRDWSPQRGREMGHIAMLNSSSKSTQALHCFHCFVPSCPGFPRFLQLENPVGHGVFTTWSLGIL